MPEKFDVTRPLIISDINYERHDPEGADKLFEFKNDPNHIVRVDDFDYINAELNVNLSSIEATQKVKSLFDELRNKYNIIAPVEFAVVDNGTGAEELFIITNRVKGERIEEISFDYPGRERTVKKLESFYLSLVMYFIDKFNTNELVLWDIAKSSAFKYGKKEGDESPDLYLVDTDVKLSLGKIGIADLADSFDTIKLIESKCGIRFDSVREKISEFVKNIENKLIVEGESKDFYWIKYFRNFLDNK